MSNPWNRKWKCIKHRVGLWTDNVSECLCFLNQQGKKDWDRRPESGEISVILKLVLLWTSWTAFSICLQANKLHQCLPLFVTDVCCAVSQLPGHFFKWCVTLSENLELLNPTGPSDKTDPQLLDLTFGKCPLTFLYSPICILYLESWPSRQSAVAILRGKIYKSKQEYEKRRIFGSV